MSRLLFFMIAALLPLYGAGPVISYSDIINGPKTGGENNLGVFVTINGKNFGAVQGTSTLTVGGGATTIKSWSDTKIVFQPGPGAVTGQIVVSTGAGPSACYQAGNCDFTVRSGRIFCVSNTAPAGTGSDSHDGKFPSDPTGNRSGCWATLANTVKTRMAVGDTIYLGSTAGETFQTLAADRIHPSYIFLFSASYPGIPKCTKTNSCAVVGYPGATAIIGGTDPVAYGNILDVLRNPGGYDYWTFANVHFLNATTSTVQFSTVLVQGSHGWRLVNNEVTMPQGAASAAVNANKTGSVDHSRDLFIYGNYVHNVSSRVNNARGVHYIYLTGDSNDVDVAWNHLDGSDSIGGSCRGVHIHSSPFDATHTNGFPQHGIYVHDNLIEHIGCDGVDLSSGDPDEAKGGWWIYNNIFNDVGNGRGVWADLPTCAPLLTSMNVASDYNWQYTTGTMHVFNNTIYSPSGSSCTVWPSNRGIFADQPQSKPWSTGMACLRPQNPQNLCSGSGCNRTRWTSSLTLDPYPSLGLWPGMNNFTARAAGGVAQQQVYDTGGSYKCNADMTPNASGANTCVELYQGGMRANGGGAKGALNLTTGAYDFSFQNTPAANTTIAYIVTQPYKIDFSNNIFYAQAGYPWYIGAESFLTEQRRIFTGSNNLFYSLHDSSPPANIPGLPSPFTANVGSNSDPLFVSNGADFRLRAGSPAIAAGAATAIARDFDGNLRQGLALDVGAYAFTGSISVPSASVCDLNGDGKSDSADVDAARNAVLGGASCGNADVNKDGACNVIDVQRVINAASGQGCNTLP